jgi:hypothetical protein
MTARWNPPPNWPAPPQAGWQPPEGWQADPSWGPAPDGWQFWVDDATGAPAATGGGGAAGPTNKRNWFLRHKVLSAIGIVVLLIVIGSAMGGGGDNAPASADGAATSKASGQKAKSVEKKAKTAAIGDKVRDGKFEFTVTKFTCGRTLVGTADFGKKAQGEFCEAALVVKNIGDEAQSLFGDNQYLFDASGKKFSADTEAAIYLDQANTLYEEINPGNSLNGTVLFDVPKGTQADHIELHDSAFSGGVVVAVK